MHHPGLVSRRQVVGGLAAGSVLPLWTGSSIAAAKTSHTFKLGEFEISVISDGHLTVPTRFLARNVSEGEIKDWLGMTADNVSPPTNVTLVRTPSDLILIDVGAGPHYMPTAGRLAENMEAAGIDRKAVTKVVFTHAHPDHLWGTLDDFDNEPMFPNASYVISPPEWNFWMADDVVSRLPEDRQNFAPGAKAQSQCHQGQGENDRTGRGYCRWNSRDRYIRTHRGPSRNRDR